MWLRSALIVLSLTGLTACAPPLDGAHMRPMPEIVQQIPSNNSLEKKVAVGAVSVPESYNQSSIGSLNSAGLKSALTESLLLANFLTRQGDEPQYTLNANLVQLDIPQFGFSMDSACSINYTLVRRSDDAQVFQQTIKQSYHAPWAEAYDAGQRSRLASAKAIRENMTQTLRVLANLTPSDLERKYP